MKNKIDKLNSVLSKLTKEDFGEDECLIVVSQVSINDEEVKRSVTAFGLSEDAIAVLCCAMDEHPILKKLFYGAVTVHQNVGENEVLDCN